MEHFGKNSYQQNSSIVSARQNFNSFMTEAVIIQKSMDWFLYDNGLRYERVKYAPGSFGHLLYVPS